MPLFAACVGFTESYAEKHRSPGQVKVVEQRVHLLVMAINRIDGDFPTCERVVKSVSHGPATETHVAVLDHVRHVVSFFLGEQPGYHRAG